MRFGRSSVTLICGVALSCAFAQSGALGQKAAPELPAAVLTAKTVAIVDDTREKDVAKGAEETLQSWGQFRLVDDPNVADLTLRFDKSREHDGQSTQKTDANGKPTDYGYSMSFSSSVHMKAYLKDSDAPFYEAKTDDSKKKAGVSCVNDFHTAFREAWQRSHR